MQPFAGSMNESYYQEPVTKKQKLGESTDENELDKIKDNELSQVFL
jgi:hypothetical protein